MMDYESISRRARNKLDKISSVEESDCIQEWNRCVSQIRSGNIKSCPRVAFVDLYFHYRYGKPWKKENGKYAVTIYDYYCSVVGTPQFDLFSVSMNSVWNKSRQKGWPRDHNAQVAVVRAFFDRTTNKAIVFSSI